MEIRKLICLACLAGALVAGSAYADPITGSGSWQDFPLTLESDGTPFVDVPSRDALRGNVAYFLSGLDGAYPGRSPQVTPQWYGGGSGEAVMSYYLNFSSYELTATLLLENTEWNGANEFGWYDASNPAVLHTLFAGADAVGASVTFTPSAQYGYYLVSAFGLAYYTQSGLNPGTDTDHQHFAAFRASAAEPDRMWIGVEDLPQALAADEMGGDYNDMVVEIVSTPEPATGLVAGGSLLALALGLRRARSKR
jgi:hypothetical protein